MRIALVHYTLPPVIGGVERILAQHARLFHEHGHEVTLVATAPNTLEEKVDGIPARVICLGSSSLSDALKAALCDQEIVFLHNVCTMPFDLELTHALLELADQERGIRFVYWIHDIAAINPAYRDTPAGASPLLRKIPATMEYIAVSDRRKAEWCELTGLDPALCQIIPNGIDPLAELRIGPKVAEIANRFALLERDLVFFQPARLLKRKNVELTLDVARATREHETDALFIITGAADPHHPPSAEYRDEILTRIRFENLSDTVVLLSEDGVIEDADLTDLYRVADALFFPSTQEGFGLPMLEAALHRIPAYCLDIEPMRSFPGAIRLPAGQSPTDLAAFLIQQLHDWDANLSRKAVVRKFGWRAIYTKFLAPLLTDTNNRCRP